MTLPDGTDYSVHAAQLGYARAYTYQDRPVAKANQMAAAQQQARNARAGIWGPPVQRRHRVRARKLRTAPTPAGPE